jgi:hypothetical protein
VSTLSGARSARRRVSVTGIAAYFSTVCAAWARLARVSQFLLRWRDSVPAPHTIPEEMPEPYISPLSTVIHPEKYIEFFCFLFIDVVVSFLKIPR